MGLLVVIAIDASSGAAVSIVAVAATIVVNFSSAFFFTSGED